MHSRCSRCDVVPDELAVVSDHLLGKFIRIQPAIDQFIGHSLRTLTWFTSSAVGTVPLRSKLRTVGIGRSQEVVGWVTGQVADGGTIIAGRRLGKRPKSGYIGVRTVTLGLCLLLQKA